MGKPKGRVVQKGKTLMKEDRERLRLQTDLVGQEMSHLPDTGEAQGRILRSRTISLNQGQNTLSTISDPVAPQVLIPPPPSLVQTSSPPKQGVAQHTREMEVQFDPGIMRNQNPPVVAKAKPPIPPHKSSLTLPSRMGNVASQTIPPQPHSSETETVEVETITTPKFTPPDPIPEQVSDEQDPLQGSEMESDDYHKISTQLTHTAAKINRRILALTLQDKTLPPSSRVGRGVTREEYAYNDGEVQLRVVLPPRDSNWSDGSGKEASSPPGAQEVTRRSLRSTGFVDLRPDFWVIDEELRTWVGSGTQPDSFYYAYSDGAKILNAIVYHPRQKTICTS